MLYIDKNSQKKLGLKLGLLLLADLVKFAPSIFPVKCNVRELDFEVAMKNNLYSCHTCLEHNRVFITTGFHLGFSQFVLLSLCPQLSQHTMIQHEMDFSVNDQCCFG